MEYTDFMYVDILLACPDLSNMCKDYYWALCSNACNMDRAYMWLPYSNTVLIYNWSGYHSYQREFHWHDLKANKGPITRSLFVFFAQDHYYLPEWVFEEYLCTFVIKKDHCREWWRNARRR